MIQNKMMNIQTIESYSMSIIDSNTNQFEIMESKKFSFKDILRRKGNASSDDLAALARRNSAKQQLTQTKHQTKQKNPLEQEFQVKHFINCHFVTRFIKNRI